MCKEIDLFFKCFHARCTIVRCGTHFATAIYTALLMFEMLLILHKSYYYSWVGAYLTLAVNTRTVLAIVPPQGCETILVEILQSKRYCLLVKTPSRS